MSNEEVDGELVALRETKGKLLAKAIELSKELETWDRLDPKRTARPEKDFVLTRNEFHDLITRDEEVNHGSKRCVALSGIMMGIKFTAVDKKWISEKKYLYIADVKTKALEFHLEVTVDAKDKTEGLEILDINCNLVNIRKCYSLEIKPWVHWFTEAKNTANLFSAVTDYTEHYITRTRILRNFQEYSIMSVEERIDDDGGITILLHSKNDPDFVYFEIHWVLRFVESLWGIDNFFVIQPRSAGDDFLNAHNEVLEGFCKYKIKKDDLQDLWKKLCAAVEQDETLQSTAGTSSS